MKVDLSFWRFVIHLDFAKTGLWSKNDDVYFLHIGTFTNGIDTGLSIIVLPVSLKIGFAC